MQKPQICANPHLGSRLKFWLDWATIGSHSNKTLINSTDAHRTRFVEIQRQIFYLSC